MKIAYIMRGLPGSGKSTWIGQRVSEWYAANGDRDDPLSSVSSADHYHMIDGVYKFDPKRSAEAHRRCLLSFIEACRMGYPLVAVDNTNVRLWEVVPYIRVAEAYEYELRIVRMVCSPEVAIIRNTHGVPPKTVWAMHQAFEDLPSLWQEVPVFTNSDLNGLLSDVQEEYLRKSRLISGGEFHIPVGK